MQDKNKEYSLGSLAEILNLTLEGEADLKVNGIATLSSASGNQISFYHNSKFFPDLKTTNAAAVILTAEAAADCPVNKLISNNPYLGYAQASRLFELDPLIKSGAHASSIIAETAIVGSNVSIGANVVIEDGVSIGDDCRIGANSFIGKDSVLGAGSLLYPGVTIYPGVHCGERTIIHAQVVLGSDGFGFARDEIKQVKIAQLGRLIIGNDIEIGAGTTIDRGALEDTVIEDGVKIDNQVQIAHNVRVGENTIICGCSAIAGSSTIGKNCTIAGAVGIINHITIADNVTVTAMSLVSKSITKQGIYSSGTGMSETQEWKKNIVHFKQLDRMNSRLKALEKNSKS